MRPFFRDLLFLFSHRDIWRFAFLLLLLICGTFIELVSLASIPIFAAVLTGAISDNLFMQYLQKFFLLFPHGDNFVFQIRLCSILFLALFTFRTIYFYLSYSLQERILKNRCIELGSRVFTEYMSAPYNFLLRHNTQDLVNNVVIETERLVNRVLGSLINLLRALIVMSAVVLMLFIYTPVVTAFALTFLLLFAGVFLYWNRKHNRIHGEREAKYRKKAMESVAEGLGAYKEILIAGQNKFFIERLHRSLEKISSSQRWLAVNQMILWPYLELVTVAVMVASTLLALNIAKHNFAEVAPALALFAAALFRLKGYVTESMLNFTALRYNMVSVNIICNDLRYLQKIRAKTTETKGILQFKKEISVKNLSFSYENADKITLQNINLKIQKGSTVAIVGETGSGKSTFLDLLLGVLQADNGRILLDEIDLKQKTKSWQQKIGFVPQAIYLLEDSIKANIALGNYPEQVNKDLLMEAIENAELQDFIDELPQGIDTILGEKGLRVSGGQRQRIGIARALYQKPEILIFDEATSALDANTEEKINQSLAKLKGKITTIIVAHRLSTVKNADEIFFFEQGKLINSGNFNELYEKNPKFKKMADNLLKIVNEKE